MLVVARRPVGHYAVSSRGCSARAAHATATTAKAAIASEAGADAVVDYRSDTAVEQIQQATQGQAIDRVVEVDIAANAELDLAVLRPGGECVVYGSGAGSFELPFFPLISKNIVLRFFVVYELEVATGVGRGGPHGVAERGALVHRIAARLPLETSLPRNEMVEQWQAPWQRRSDHP